MSTTSRGNGIGRWRRLSALAAVRVALAEQRVTEVDAGRNLARGELDAIATFCARRVGMSDALTSLVFAAADKRRTALLAVMQRLDEAAEQAAGELATARRAAERCRIRLAAALRDASERWAEEERQEHVARQAIAAIPGQASSGKVRPAGHLRARLTGDD